MHVTLSLIVSTFTVIIQCIYIHVAMVPLFSSDLSAMMMESWLPGRNLNEENPRNLFNGCKLLGQLVSFTVHDC